MPLPPGARLGPYEILSPLGEGGMGEVYRARDPRLGREIAIKVLPAELSSERERLARFEQEARSASALNHPNIVTIYEIGQADSVPYIAMELVEGKTLRELLVSGPLPLRKTLGIAAQVAGGLARAHEAGIVHRDLKPENLMVSKDEFVKILDFGLAKLVAPASGALSGMATAVRDDTRPGTVLGTVGYMSPEQASGRALDFRSDQFSFGSILYEMATGKRAFSRGTAPETLSAIIREEPEPIGVSSPAAPHPFRWIVERCHAKDPEERYASTRDLARDLANVREHISEVSAGGGASLPSPAVTRRRRPERLAWITAAIFCLGLLSALPFVIAYFKRAPAEGRVLKLSVLPPEKTAIVPGHIAISPDGRRLAFVATSDGKNLLWVRPLDSLVAQPLPGTEEPFSPFWSPDSRLIGFFADQKLKKIEASGGPPQTLCDAPNGRGGTWNREDTILFAPTPTGILYRVSAAGGEARPVTKLDEARQENSHRWPYFLPDGRHFLYFARSRLAENRAIYAGSLDSEETRRLLNANSNAAFSPPGFLLFVREGAALVARSFDPKSLQLTGEPFLVTEKVKPSDPMEAASFTVSDTGVLAYVSGSGSTAGRRLAWLDRAGRQLGSVGHSGIFVGFKLSPDQKRVALDLVDAEVGGRQIWVLEFSRGVASRFAFGALADIGPVWSPDGGRIAFSSDREGPAALYQLYQKASSGVGSEELLLKSRGTKTATDWSLDGRFILYETSEPGSSTRRDLWVLPLVGDRKARPVLQTPFNESQGSFSPDGRWILYVSDETGRPEVYVQSFPVSTGKWTISADGGDRPRWRADGKELFYVARDRRLTAVTVTAGSSTFEVGSPQPLFEILRAKATAPFHQYDVTADGQRFLVSGLAEGQISLPVSVVFNWTAELPQ